MDLSWSEFSLWPQEIIDSSPANLLALKLHHNFLKEIPAQIQSLTHLVHLDISNNKLSKIPDELVKLKVDSRIRQTTVSLAV
jgi:Leucine-rich repeat (LRR) protein